MPNQIPLEPTESAPLATAPATNVCGLAAGLEWPDAESRFDASLTFIAPRRPSAEARRRSLLRRARPFRAGDFGLDGDWSER